MCFFDLQKCSNYKKKPIKDAYVFYMNIKERPFNVLKANKKNNTFCGTKS